MTSLFRQLPFGKIPGSAIPRPVAPTPSTATTTTPPTPIDTDDPTTEPEPTTTGRRRSLSLLTLPPEIQLMISQQLIYPDALSLKHTNRYFYRFVDTGVKLKIDWLIKRRRLHLECPNNQRCDLGSDLRFCRGSVRLLMERRREHMECESRPGLGCLIYGTSTCTHRRKLSMRLRRWLGIRFTIEIWRVLLALVPIVVAWLCLAG
ncbi:hypothetical protein B0T17DRAFT_613212 [Bombardia bombarda]|uniref:F-box domain-containing protein n=1 Tax=Bombardia bombarda TaxID=252184 RepID=A0AA39XMQ9_9PEZI|nr:hypothetical protein B0T17DRAFT_613212 [Bombardia bombarda]